MRLAQPLDAANVRRMIGLALADHRPGRVLHQLDGVLLVAEGRSCQEVGQWFGVDRRTVQRWVQHTATQGLPGRDGTHHGGRPKALTAQLAQAVRRDLQASPALLGYPEAQWSGKRLALHLQQRCGVLVSVRSCQRLIAHSRQPSQGG